jgi:hypothetical protein
MTVYNYVCVGNRKGVERTNPNQSTSPFVPLISTFERVFRVLFVFAARKFCLASPPTRVILP